jgi:hypothetical protein
MDPSHTIKMKVVLREPRTIRMGAAYFVRKRNLVVLPAIRLSRAVLTLKGVQNLGCGPTEITRINRGQPQNAACYEFKEGKTGRDKEVAEGKNWDVA